MMLLDSWQYFSSLNQPFGLWVSKNLYNTFESHMFDQICTLVVACTLLKIYAPNHTSCNPIGYTVAQNQMHAKPTIVSPNQFYYRTQRYLDLSWLEFLEGEDNMGFATPWHTSYSKSITGAIKHVSLWS